MEEKTSEKDAFTLTTRELRSDLSEAIMRTHYGKEHIIVTHHGRKYAALIPFEELLKWEAVQNLEKEKGEKEEKMEA